MPLDSSLHRREVLRLIAGGAVLAAAGPSVAGETRIARLIAETQRFQTISVRIDYISGALRGTRYRGYTLIGGPHEPEQFVLRDDAFDCVTFCETVLAAAGARDVPEFESNLRQIRYRSGVVNWFARNHYFFEWGRHNVENKICHAIAMDGAVAIEKTVYWHRELGRRKFDMTVIPRAVLLANTAKLASGDIIGFVTQRPNLDYFHVGFVILGDNGELLLRHAALSRHRVLDERLDRFLAFNRVRYVTLLRPEQPAGAAVTARKAG
jgi:hypothetical protein